MATGAGSTGISTTGWVAAGAVVVAAGAAGLYYAGFFTTQPEPQAVISEMEAPAPEIVASTIAPTPEPVVEAPVTTPDPEAAPDPVAETTAAPETESEPAAQENETPDAPPVLIAPAFDVVRVDRDGSTVIAGTGLAGSIVTIFLDGEKQDQVTVDANGKFASLLFLDPSDVARILTLMARSGEQSVEADDQIILAPTPAKKPEPVVVAEAVVEPESAPKVASEPVDEPQPVAEIAAADEPAVTTEPVSVAEPTPVAEPKPVAEPTSDAEPTITENPMPAAEPATVEEPATVARDVPATEPAPAAEPTQASEPAPVAEPTTTAKDEPVAEPAPVTEPESVAAPASSPEPTAEPEPAAPAPVAVLRADADGVELLQPATPPDTADVTNLVLDTIGYSEAGDVLLSGRAQPDSVIRIYLDNAAIVDLNATTDGRWRGKLDGIEPGLYTLRLDAVDQAGKVLSRLETPFVRETLEDLHPTAPENVDPSDTSPSKPTPPIRLVTVQTGDTLWAISRERYGDGVLYVKVFEANRQHIRNPHLIYPGQVFAIPD
jgi:nucleoid-associated protein YgaU